MAFSRVLTPSIEPAADVLTGSMVGIGMRFAARALPDANIEDTLLFAAGAAVEEADFRVLGILVTWFGVHAAWVNADRLTKLVQDDCTPRARAFWASLARWQAKDRRFAKLAKAFVGAPLDLLETGTEFQIERHGADERFTGGALRVPANVLRDRAVDVLTPAELARQHGAYRYRVMLGPSYRADMWALLEREPSLTPTEIARQTYGSFATAWQVKRDFQVIHGAAHAAERGRRKGSH